MNAPKCSLAQAVQQPEISCARSSKRPPRLAAAVRAGACLLLTAACCARAQSTYTTPYIFTTLAGDASNGQGSSDGTGSAAQFYYPSGVAVDSSANVYVAATVHDTIR